MREASPGRRGGPVNRSADAESVRLKRTGPGHVPFDPVHPRQRRAMRQPAGECVDRIGRSRREHLHPAVVAVDRVSARAERRRFGACMGAERDALHAAVRDEARGRGQPFDASAIASSRLSPVTGPSTFFATRPSGAISTVIGRPRGVSKSAGGS